MAKLDKDDLIEAYRATYDAIPRQALELDFRVTIRTMQALAEGKPVSPERLSESWEMPLEQVRVILEQAVANGQASLDEQGNLVDGVLSFLPTRHRITMDDIQLYAWCAYDAIYAPGVVGKTARIVSSDPVTGETIELTVTPAGVSEVCPESTVVSVVTETDSRGGAASPRCSQMLFFGSRDSAEEWLGDGSDVAILTVEEALEIVEILQIEPARSLGLI